MVLRVVVALLGAAVVLGTLSSALKTVVVPRAYPALLTRLHFVWLRLAFGLLARPSQPFERRDRVLALYAPTGLILLPAMWVSIVVAGFTAIFWGAGVRPVTVAFETSGSSLLTLGFLRPPDAGPVTLTFVEAGIGLGLVSLMISYLPTIYGAFSRREALVGMLEVRAGLPPSIADLLTRYSRIGWLDRVYDDVFEPWERWFVDVEESHTSQSSLVFFRSPHPERSWITAAGCVLDAAAIVTSTVDLPHDARADVMIRGGFLTLRRIADVFSIPYTADPAPSDPISVSRLEYDQLCDKLRVVGIPLKADLDQAWRDFAGWRVNYDQVLVAMCALVVAPPAQWSSDRPGAARRMPLSLSRRRRMRPDLSAPDLPAP